MTHTFAKDSTIRRVNSEPAIMFGAGRALLLQLAHPAVAQGVADHSGFQANPFARLRGTLEAMNAAVYGSAELAREVGQRVQRVHDFIVGPEYRANDPENLLWVHATLTDTALDCYTSLVRPLAPDEAEQYYEEMTRVAELFGLPRQAQPPDLASFRSYVAATVESLEVTDVARRLARDILHPRLPLRLEVGLAPAVALQRLHAVGGLPPRLREGFGFSWNPVRQRLYDQSRAQLRLLHAVTPRSIRTLPGSVRGELLLRQAARRSRPAA